MKELEDECDAARAALLQRIEQLCHPNSSPDYLPSVQGLANAYSILSMHQQMQADRTKKK
jgi:hypothetical protein